MNVLVIIPAKTDSKRLPKKNLQKINGKTSLWGELIDGNK